MYDALRPYSDGTPCFVELERRGGERTLRLSFRTARMGGVERAWVRTAPDGEAEYAVMRKRVDGPFERWEGRVPVRGDRLMYRFILLCDGRLSYLNQLGHVPVPPFDLHDFVWLEQALPVPWLVGTTFYQIFPDRFHVGDPTRWQGLDSYTYFGKRPVLRPWGSSPLAHGEGGHIDFYGGDLVGIGQKIPYLQDLGVGALYLNPVFHAPSNHRYDTQDFRTIDPRLGTNEDFAHLVTALHGAGIRVILDAVFNHVGCGHHWFNKEGFYGQPGAYQEPHGALGEYFVFHGGNPDRYDCWLGVESLPKLDFRSRRLRDEFYGGPDAIATRWLLPPYGADGWRFDVANMLARNGPEQLHGEVWREMRRHVKAARPDAYLMGEHFFDPADLLDGSQLDGVMNYQGFYFPLLRWLTGREHQLPRDWKGLVPIEYGAEDFAVELTTAMARLPFQVAQGQFNVMGSHDTTRILSHLGGDRDLLRVAATLLMTWPGVPCVYYGDEVGLEGVGDPDCRRCMPWDEASWDQGVREWFKALIVLRRVNRALAAGGTVVEAARGDVLAFWRVYDRQVCLIVANRGATRRRLTVDGERWGLSQGALVSPLTGTTVELRTRVAKVSLAPRSADVFELGGA